MAVKIIADIVYRLETKKDSHQNYRLVKLLRKGHPMCRMNGVILVIYFHNIFGNIIDKGNLKIKLLAEQTGVDRASIYQYKNGKSLPSKDFLDKFISVMQLSNSEENELRESYNIAKIGVSTYLKRNQMKRCFEILNDAIFDNVQMGYKPSTAQIMLPDHSAVFSGKDKITALVKNVIDFEFALANECEHEVSIKTFIPSNYTEFYQHLSELYHSHKGMTINFEPIISFTKTNNYESNNIIEAFSSIMYFIFTDCPGYNPRFYYDENNFLDSIGILYPYYIITTRHLIILDVKLNNAQIILDNSVIENYCTKFNEAFSKTKPLIKKFPQLIDMLTLLMEKNQAQNSDWVLLNADVGCCIHQFADDDMVAKYINQKYINLAQVLNYHTLMCRHEHIGFYKVFQTINGIKDFAKTGKINQIQSILKNKISVEDRKVLLNIAYENPNEIGNLIDHNKIKIPPITMMIYKNDMVIMYIDVISDILIISEPEIANAFYDFLYSLIDSEYIISDTDGIKKVINECIAICDKQLSSPEL